MAVDPSKYKVYAERDVTKSQVNWADAAKTITTDLTKIREDRANKRAQIESDTTLNGQAQSVRVTSASNYGVYNINNIDYLGVEFIVEVIA